MRSRVLVYTIITFSSIIMPQEKKEHPCKQWLDMVDNAIEKQSLTSLHASQTIQRAQQAGCTSLLKVLYIKPEHSCYYEAAGAHVTCNAQTGQCEAKIDFSSKK